MAISLFSQTKTGQFQIDEKVFPESSLVRIFSSIQVYCCNTRRLLYELPKRRVSAMEYSPRDTYLLVFEPFTSM